MASILKKILKFILFTLLALLIAGGAALFIFRDSNVGTGFIQQKIPTIADSAGYNVSVASLKGNPWKGYSAGDVFVAAEGALSADIGFLEAKLSPLAFFTTEPVINILIKDGDINIIDPTAFPASKEKKGKIWFPHITLTLENIDISAPQVNWTVNNSVLDVWPDRVTVSLQSFYEQKALDAEVTIDMADRGIALDSVEIDFEDNRILEASGKLLPDLDLKGAVTSLDFSPVAELLPVEGLESLQGNGYLDFSLRGTISEPVFNGDLRIADPGFKDFKLKQINANLNFENNTFSMKNLNTVIAGSEVSADLSAAIGGPFSLSFKSEPVDLSRIKDIYPGIPPSLEGRVETLSGNISGTPGNIQGEITLRSSSLSAMNQTVTDTALNIYIEGEKARVESSLEWEGETVKAQGTVELTGNNELDMKMVIKDLETEKFHKFIPPESQEYIPVGIIDISVTAKGEATDPRITAEMSSPSLNLPNGAITDISADLDYGSGKVDLNKVQLTIPGGNLSASGSVNLTGGKTLDIKLLTKIENLEKALSLAPTAIKDISGSAEADIRIKGNLDKPEITGTFNSSNLNFRNIFKAERVQGSIILADSIPSLEVSVPVAIIDKLLVNELMAKVKLDKHVLTLENASANLMEGSFTSSGRVILGDQIELDLSGNFENVDLEDIPWQIPADIHGQTDGNFAATGTVSSPKVTFDTITPSLVTEGTTLDNVELAGRADQEKIKLEKISAYIGESAITGEATINLSETLKAEFQLAGKQLSIPYLLRNMDGNLKELLEGKVNLELDGSFRSGLLLGKGIISSESLSFQGLTITDFYCPMVIDGTTADIPGLNASVYSGDLEMAGNIDLANLSWEGDLAVTSMDLAELAEDIENVPLTLSGTAETRMNIRGRGADLFSIFGTGNLTASGGDIGGLPAIKAAAATGGKNTIAFKRIRSNFLIDGFGITILAGSRVQAPRKYPLYKELAIDGNIEYKGALDIEGEANVNLQAMNAFMGGLKTALRATLAKGDLVEDIMGGFLGQAKKKDFRQVIFHIEGTREAPTITKLEVQGGQEYLTDLINLDEFGEPERETDNKQIKIQLNFPVGEGGSPDSESGEDQFKDQLIESILKGINPLN